MTNQATVQKREQLLLFIRREIEPEPAVQAVVGIGSLAMGTARLDSDIDAIIFLDPFDSYIVPAEFIWRPADGAFVSIFSQEAGGEHSMQFDFARLDLAQWGDPAYEWPEGRRAELSEGWLAFDRGGQVGPLIAERTAYTDEVRIARLDEAITWLDQHLSNGEPEYRWERHGPLVAHDRLQAAYDFLVHALFAYNRRWRPWRTREMSHLLGLSWLPDDFEARVMAAMAAPSQDYEGYLARVESLRALFRDVLARLVADGEYGGDVVGEAFRRSHAEPGRFWNMDEWNARHLARIKQSGS